MQIHFNALLEKYKDENTSGQNARNEQRLVNLEEIDEKLAKFLKTCKFTFPFCLF